ncbi:MAG: holin family protein [Alphaproteobacteria bacterium]|nr:holin family protein [Alphaproteobacteria bacterium]
MDPISIALGIASYAAPKAARWLFGDEAEKAAEEVIGTARAVTGESDETKLLDALKASPEALAAFQAQMQELEIRKLEEETKRLRTVNATMQAEYASDDKVVKRWRPVFGYCMAVTWVIQIAGTTGGTLYAIIAAPANAGAILTAIGQATAATVPMWAVGLSVVGVSIIQRSQDKRVAAGVAGPGLLAGLAQKLTRPR